MSKAELIKSWNEFVSLSKRDFRNVKIGTKYVTCIEYLAYESNSPRSCRFSEFDLDQLLLDLSIQHDLNAQIEKQNKELTAFDNPDYVDNNYKWTD